MTVYQKHKKIQLHRDLNNSIHVNKECLICDTIIKNTEHEMEIQEFATQEVPTVNPAFFVKSRRPSKTYK